MADATPGDPLLSVRELCVDYVTPDGPVRAVDRVSLEVARGEILGLAGESGSGKSTLAQAVMRVLPPPAVISSGRVVLEDTDVTALDEPALRRVRWRRMAMVFQSAMDALSPVSTVGEQLVDTLAAHGVARGRAARERAGALLADVGISADRLDSYPHQLSGGMRQRVGIALALALDPALVILDEPTTALDVVLEREILEQVLGLERQRGFAAVFVTHDLARMLEVSDRVAVLYAARLVEVAPAAALRDSPRHPYTRALLRAFPRAHGDGPPPRSIPGLPPSLVRPPRGCRFHPRCEEATDECRVRAPELRRLGPGHAVACHRAGA